MQPRTPQEEIKRAGEAQRILNDPVFKDSFDQIEQALLSGMRSSGISDDKLRLRLLDLGTVAMEHLFKWKSKKIEIFKIEDAQLFQDPLDCGVPDSGPRGLPSRPKIRTNIN